MPEKKRGRPLKTERLVFDTLEDAIKAECPQSYIPYRVTLLNQVLFTMASSASNAVKFTAYFLGANAKPISVREAVAAALNESKHA